MSNREMLDCTGSNASRLKARYPNPQMVAYYATGSVGVFWSQAERSLFAGSQMVSIDQGYTGSPVAAATVRDVEKGAWSLQNAVDRTGWIASRPTIYCGVSNAIQLGGMKWDGDVWLAYPGFTGTVPPKIGNLNIVGVQNQYLGWYDKSVVFDLYWPHKQPQGDNMLYLVAETGNPAFAGFHEGTFQNITLFRDFIDKTTPMEVRVAIRYSNATWDVNTHLINGAAPLHLPFQHPNANAVSVRIESGPSPITATLW